MRLGRLHSILKSTQRDFKLANTSVVIDAKTFFLDTYKNSGCQYIFGGEYDRYSEYLRNVFNNFKEANVTCYVIFNANFKQADIDTRLKIHKNVISQADSVSPLNKDTGFCEPALFKDVVKQVLDELHVKYVVSEDYLSELVHTAKQCNFMIITKDIEYSLLGVRCCPPKSLQFNTQSKSFTAKFYDPEDTRQRIVNFFGKLSVILVLLDEDNDFLKDLQNVIRYPLKRELNATLVWVKRHSMQVILSDISKNLEKTKYDRFLKEFNRVKELLQGRNETTKAISHFTGKQQNGGKISNWYLEGLTSGRIPISYAILMKYNVVNGSWLVFDKEKEDAMLAAIEIFEFVGAVFSDFTNNNFTFIGRVQSAPQAWNIKISNFVKPKNMPDWKKHPTFWKYIPDFFVCFLTNQIPGLDLNIINKAPEDCRLLMITLVYYGSKINNEFLYGVYSVLLSYVMLGPVGRVTGAIKRMNLLLPSKSSNHEQINDEISNNDCITAAQAIVDLFYVDDSKLKKTFDRKLLHYFAEFQHCLLHMNNLNRFCGEKMKGTIYHSTYNATFIYNMVLRLKESDKKPMAVVESFLGKSPSVFNFYKNLVQIFHSSCRDTTRIF